MISTIMMTTFVVLSERSFEIFVSTITSSSISSSWVSPDLLMPSSLVFGSKPDDAGGSFAVPEAGG